MACWRNLFTRKLTASGIVDADGNPISSYGRIHRIDVAAAGEVIIRKGPDAGDDPLHTLYVPACGLVPGCDAAWRLPEQVHYIEVSGTTWITFV